MLEDEEHTLYYFTSTKGGARLNPPLPYQCILDMAGKKAGYTYSWKPTDAWTSCVIHSEDDTHRLLTVTAWPYHPGGLHFRLAEVDPEEPKDTGDVGYINMAREHMDEVAYLKAQKDRGQKVVREVVNPDEWLRAICQWMDATPTKEALDQLRTHLERNLIDWPPTPAQLAELRKGGSLVLADDMCPNDVQRTWCVTTAPIPDFDAHYAVEIISNALAEPPKKVHRLVVYKGDGESRTVASGSLEHVTSFVTYEEYSSILVSQGWTHYRILFGENEEIRSTTPIAGKMLKPRVRGTAHGGGYITVHDTEGTVRQYRIRTQPQAG
jgi:hypothetical protein